MLRLAALCLTAALAEGVKPNLLLIIAVSSPLPHSHPTFLFLAGALPSLLAAGAQDDYGHNDIGYHGGEVPTPHMDGLANAGVKLDSFYTQPICAATRSSIMSGRYVIRTGFQHNNPPKALGGVGAIPLTEKLLPEYMKDAGYAAHLVGKA